jgi:REP element-mobilizing transposase RayT
MADREERRGHRALRKGRFSEAQRPYFITTVTHDRLPLFRDLFLARKAVQTLAFLEAEGSLRTWAYVLMPDHLHWLMEPRAGHSLSSLMRRAKADASRKINDYRGTPGAPVWQRGFHDRALRRDEDLREAARYLVANPLRAGLVQDLGDYALWDAAWASSGKASIPE